MTSSELIAKYPYATERASLDHPAVNVPAHKLLEFLKAMRDEAGFDLLVDVTAIDWEGRKPRFTVVYHLLATTSPHYLRVATDCPDDAAPEVPSVVSLWAGANWHERETYDMFGIKFAGHPDLRRILMWDTYPYFPLRKEFPLAGIEVPFPAADVAERTGESVKPAPMMGGPFTATHGSNMREKEPCAKDESWTEKLVKPTH
ncbi:MAG: NADH-quinone oxidoreductase subunit C [Verrucomicrobiota bacterium]|nr:NADH-quinone oxidoreductase subunit C [Verrucomicrobiota bacterium]